VIASEEPSMQHLIRCATVQAARWRAAVKVACCLNQFSPKGSRELGIKYAGSGLRVEGLQHAFGYAILVLSEGGRRFKAYAASCENASEEGIIVFAAAIVAAKPPNGTAILSLDVRFHFAKGIGADFAVLGRKEVKEGPAREVVNEHDLVAFSPVGVSAHRATKIRVYKLKRTCSPALWLARNATAMLGADADGTAGSVIIAVS
jgi:hypothetical protein